MTSSLDHRRAEFHIIRDTTGEAAVRMLSIVITNYNYERYLSIAVESALAQSPPRQVVVVDDGSTDRSRSILSEYGDRIEIIEKENGGQASAFYAGFLAATGDVIIFLDADDLLYPSCADVVRNHLVPGASKVQFRLDTIGPNGENRNLPFPYYHPGMDPEFVFRRLVETGWYPCPVTSGNAWSHEYLAKVLPIDPRCHGNADGYLNILAPLYGKVISVLEVLGAYRVHGSNFWASQDAGLSSWRYLKHEIQRHAVLKEHSERLQVRIREDALLNSPQHLENRMRSLRFTRNLHPVPQDRRAALLVRSLRTLALSRDLGFTGRLAWTAYLFVLATAPLTFLKRLLPILRGSEHRSNWARLLISATRFRGSSRRWWRTREPKE
jgi:glycosyl transferase family 2